MLGNEWKPIIISISMNAFISPRVVSNKLLLCSAYRYDSLTSKSIRGENIFSLIFTGIDWKILSLIGLFIWKVDFEKCSGCLPILVKLNVLV